ncbi:MAG: hypothetical protein ACOY5C_02770 [Pseudomonadota bacterium]
MIRGFLAAYVQRLALFALLLALAIAGWQQTQVWRLEARLSQAAAKLIAQAQALQQRDLLIARQHQAVADWQAAAGRQAEHIAQAQAAAAAIRQGTQHLVQRSLQAPVPSDCAGAVRWGAAAGRQIGQQWEAGS